MSNLPQLKGAYTVQSQGDAFVVLGPSHDPMANEGDTEWISHEWTKDEAEWLARQLDIAYATGFEAGQRSK